MVSTGLGIYVCAGWVCTIVFLNSTKIRNVSFLAHQIRKSWIQPWDRHSYPTQGKIKIENFHVFDMHWLLWKSSTPSLRVTSLKVMTSLNGTVMLYNITDVSNWSDCIIKKSSFRTENVCKKNNLSWVWGRSTLHTHDRFSGEVSLVMPDSDPGDGLFYLPLTPMIDPYNLARSFTSTRLLWWFSKTVSRCIQ